MPRLHRSAAAVTGAATLTLAALMAPPLAVAASGSPAPATHGKDASSNTKAASDQVHREHFDSRRDGKAGEALTQKAARNAAKPRAQVAALKTSLGTQGLVTIDPLTGSPRQIARADGFLTGPSRAGARDIALGYVRANHGVFGLDASALAGLTLRKDYVDVAGTHHLSFIQQVKGIPVFGNGLLAHVTKDGRLIAFTGSPLTSLSGLPGREPRRQGRGCARVGGQGRRRHGLGGAQPRSCGATHDTRFDGGDRAALVWFKTVGGTVLAWQTQVAPSTKELYSVVVDASSGRVLYRSSLVDNDTAVVWENSPGATRGGTARQVTLPNSWLPQNSSVLQGPNAHVFTDVNDDNAASTTEEIRPQLQGPLRLHVQAVRVADPRHAVRDELPLLVGAEHAELLAHQRIPERHPGLLLRQQVPRPPGQAAPIGFTEAAGNFQQATPRRGRRRRRHPAAGRRQHRRRPARRQPHRQRQHGHAAGRPGADHADVPLAPARAPAPAQDPFIATNGGDEADIVYHEYTHGLSNRLVVDADGNSTLGNVQAGSMGEAWSDWYAMDYLVNQGQLSRTPGEPASSRSATTSVPART